MRILAPAVGAALAAILESSVLAHLQMGSLKPDLVFAVGIAVTMVLGFDSGVTWAFVGGVMLDVLTPERALGSTALTLLLATGIAFLVARALWPPRALFIAATVLALSIAYHLTLLSVLTIMADLSFTGLAVTEMAITAVMDVLIASAAVVVLHAVDLRFGEPERSAW